MKCQKCGNETLPPEHEIGVGITARPCPICGYQHYSFPEGMQQTTTTALPTGEIRYCYDCGKKGIGKYSRYCKECITRRQSSGAKRYNEKKQQEAASCQAAAQ